MQQQLRSVRNTAIGFVKLSQSGCKGTSLQELQMIIGCNNLFRYLAAGALILTVSISPAAAQPPPGIFAPPVKAENLDRAAFSVWTNGTETAAELPSDGPTHALWTTTSAPQWDGIHFGNSKTPGKRHLRIGLRAPISVGTVLTRGDVTVSVLRSSAPYPGALANETQWISAYRLKSRQQTSLQPQQEEYAVWVLPPGTATRALRFTHEAQVTDTSYAGWLGGAYVLPDRVCNVADQAEVETRSNTEKSGRIIDGSNNNTWDAWDNGEHPAALVSEQNPEWIRLTWPTPVTLSGLNALWAGFGAVTVQTFVGPSNSNPAEASEDSWKTIKHWDDIANQYPRALAPNLLDFGTVVTTRAIRLLITRAGQEQHPHLSNKTQAGARVWLGELQAIHPLNAAALVSAVLPAVRAGGLPSIPVKFHLTSAGHVTLVIEDAQGKRVRNLVSDTPFPAGDNTVWWDGTNDLGRDPDAARHGIYHIPAQLVAPGSYHVRGIVHSGLHLRYEFSIYTAGNPAWETADHTGGWLANHTPPSSVLFVSHGPDQPAILAGSYVTEGGSGLAWLDLDGRKRDGKGWIGGNWTGAPYLARDNGDNSVADVYAYAAAAWGELRLTALTKNGDRPVLNPPYIFPGEPKNDHNPNSAVSGIAVHNGLLVASLPKLGKLFFVDARAGRQIGSTDCVSPRGVAFTRDGHLLALSGSTLVVFTLNAADPANHTERRVLIAKGLEDPQGIAVDNSGSILISDHGKSHQIKLYSADGTLIRTIGHPGEPAVGAYDPEHMNHPLGITVDNLDRIWVAENDFQPKRLSVWSKEGKLLKAFYGPAEYGGGGTLDPNNKSRFYFHGMEFALNWADGTSKIKSVFYRPGAKDMVYPDGFGVGAPPETPIYSHGRQYLTNCFNSNPTNGASIAMIWELKGSVAHPAAAMGRANDWSLLRTPEFNSRWPEGCDPAGDMWRNQAAFIWSDLNGDGKPQPSEVTIWKASVGGITVMPDLSFVASRLNDAAMRFAPTSVLPTGVPIYTLAASQTLVKGSNAPLSSGGDQALSIGSWTILTCAPNPFSAAGLGGAKGGVPMWSYPSLWPGLHASHESPAPEYPGEIIGTTRLLGGSFTPTKGEAGPLFCINGNMGCMYLFTADGLFVSTLFQDVRQGSTWTMPSARRGTELNALTLHDENFWPTITQTADGTVYLNSGHPSLVRLDGLDSVHRIRPAALVVTAADLRRAAESLRIAEIERQKLRGSQKLTVLRTSAPPRLAGGESGWEHAEWASIDRRGVPAFFDSNSKPYNVMAAVAIDGTHLHVIYRTNDPELLKNAADTPAMAFKTGGALDLMLNAIEGGERLLVTQIKGKTTAVLYRQKAAGHGTPMAFSSPLRTVPFASVEDISAQVVLQEDHHGTYQVSIPLSMLGPESAWMPGATVKADLGILRGNGFQTLQRVYWSNKATGIVADVPSEAELTPLLWGTWHL
jgi:hypothetical protein